MTERTTSATLPTTTGFRRLLDTRGVAIYALALVLFAVLLTLSLRGAGTWLSSSNLGLRVYPSGRLWVDATRWPGVVGRDAQILAIDGKKCADYAAVNRAVRELAPGKHAFVVRQDGRDRVLQVEARSRSIVEQVVFCTRIIVGVLMFIIGLGAFYLSPGHTVSWYFVLFSVGLGTFGLAPSAFDRELILYSRVMHPAITTMAVFGQLLFMSFPRRLPWISTSKRRMILVSPGPLLLAVFLATYPRPELKAIWGPAGNLIQIWLALATLMILVFLVLQRNHARRTQDTRALSQYRALVVGMVLGGFIPTIWNVVRMVFGLLDNEWAYHLNLNPTLLLGIMIGYAMLRPSSLAIDRFTSAVVGYSASLVLVGALFVSLLFGLPLLFGGSRSLQSPMVWVAVTAVAFVGFTPIYRRLKRRLDRWFFRAPADAGRLAEVLRELARTIQKADREKSYEAVLRATETLPVERVELWTLTDSGDALVRTVARGAPVGSSEVARDGSIGEALASNGYSAGIEGLAPRALEDDAQAELWAHELALAVPVTTFGVFSGFVGLGRKLSGTAFTTDDVAFYEAVASHLSLALERGSAEPTQFGTYRVEKRLGVGGMAEVFLVWQVGPGGFERKAALKRLLPNFAEEPEVVSMFLDEARIAAQLTHKNIVQIYEVGRQDSLYFIAMEYVDGPSLRQLIRATCNTGPLPLEVAVGILTRVLAGLAFAHTACDGRGRRLGVVHRDVTPTNIQLTRGGDVKLLDFGIARAETQLHVTRTGMVKGTLPYMSPEQASGQPVDYRSDLYSVGAILYEVLCDRRAFPDGPSRQAPPPPSTLRASLPEALDQLTMQAIAFRPEARPGSAEELEQALAAAIAPAVPATDRQIAEWVRQVSVPQQPATTSDAKQDDLETVPER